MTEKIKKTNKSKETASNLNEVNNEVSMTSDSKDASGNKVQVLLTALQILLVIFLILTSAILILSNVDNPLNLRVFSVSSGSMEPTISTGSIVFVQKQEAYNVQDIITYASRANRNATTTHRIIEIFNDADLGRISYGTQGDANEDPDFGITLESQIIGKVIFQIPFVGYFVNFAKTQAGFIVFIVIPATIIIYTELQNIIKELKNIFLSRKNKDEN